MTADQTQPQRNRLTEPSSAAGFAALLALLVPSIADVAPAIVELGVGALAAVAGIAAIIQREAR
jgi:hypothetical protein